MSSTGSCQTCDLLDTCDFYWNYKDLPAVSARQMIKKYCHSIEESTGCARILYQRLTGDLPISELSPEGDFILSDRKEIQPSPLPVPAEPNSTSVR